MNFFKKEIPYDKSKEFLDRQQKIEMLLVFTKLLEQGMDSDLELKRLVNKKITNLVDDLK